MKVFPGVSSISISSFSTLIYGCSFTSVMDAVAVLGVNAAGSVSCGCEGELWL